jgi:hypothetical protein
MQREHLAELQSLLDLQTSCEEFVLDLKELKLVDRESIRFLACRINLTVPETGLCQR